MVNICLITNLKVKTFIVVITKYAKFRSFSQLWEIIKDFMLDFSSSNDMIQKNYRIFPILIQRVHMKMLLDLDQYYHNYYMFFCISYMYFLQGSSDKSSRFLCLFLSSDKILRLGISMFSPVFEFSIKF